MSDLFRPKRNYCCVVGCSNNQVTNSELHFYRFPGRSYQVEQKNQWIAAIKQVNEDGKQWVPGPEARVCSTHFVGGKKSENMHDLAYVPRIFPDIYGSKILDQSRAERLRKRKIAETMTITQAQDYETDDIEVEVEAIKKVNSGVQTEPCIEFPSNEISILYCWNKEDEASTQANICILKPQQNKIIIDKKHFVTTKDKSCGHDVVTNPGFMGFQDVQTNNTMRQLAGVTIQFFFILLQLLEVREDRQPAFYRTLGKENRLLLFLMKIKLGISFCALGCLFHIHSTTAARVFYSVLTTLTMKTKSWIFWPSRESVRLNLPKSFQKYPNCRCIIDCTELLIDTPSTVEQRVLMYSNYKGRFTVKFLIAITPDGYICKVSKGYGGKSTDSFITNDCGFLTLLEPGDQVLADKGFPQIESELSKRNAILIIPPFAFNPQFTEEEVERGYNIASVRIHVERAIQRIKLSQILSHISADLLPCIDAIMHICCVIANSQPPLINEKEK